MRFRIGPLPLVSYDAAVPSEKDMRKLVEAYAKGIVCSGEVFNQYLDNISQDTLDAWMSSLSPELIERFRQNLGVEVELPLATPEDIGRWRRAEALIEKWLRERSPENHPRGKRDPASG